MSDDTHASVPGRFEQHLEPIAEILVGRRAIHVTVVTSSEHGRSVKLAIFGPQPASGGKRAWQDTLYADELDTLLAALTTAKARLGTARRPQLPPRKALR